MDHSYTEQAIDRERFQQWYKAMPGYIHAHCPEGAPCRIHYGLSDTLNYMARCTAQEDPAEDITLPRLCRPPRASDAGPELRYAFIDAVNAPFVLGEKCGMGDMNIGHGDTESSQRREAAAAHALAEVVRMKSHRQGKARMKREVRSRKRKEE